VIVRIAGEAHVSQAGELADGLLRLSARRPSVVALDLGGLNCLSCLATGVLVTFCRGIVRAGGRVRLASALQDPVRDSLERAGLRNLCDPASVADSPNPPRKGSAETMNPIPKGQDVERTHGVTWNELAALEPRLGELLRQARVAGASCRSWQEVRPLFAPFRDAVAELVGFLSRNRGHTVLGSVAAYEVAYWRLHDAIAGLLPRPATDPPRADVRTRAAANRKARRVVTNP
jgi:anti-anti-sigma factor